MAHKIRPTSLRLGVSKGWISNWFPKKKDFRKALEEDVVLRKIIKNKIASAGIESVLIERTGNKCRITIRASRPGLIIGRGGKGVEELIKSLEQGITEVRKKQGEKTPVSINLNIEELKRSEVASSVIAQNIAWDLEKRLPYRRTIKKYLDQIMQNREIKGAKIRAAGRLDGAEIARDEHLERGSLPLQTLRADIDYGEATAFTIYGAIGIKVWIYKGEIFNK